MNVTVGDKMRFSLELLEQIRNEGNRTQLCRVVRIEQHDDGEKTVWLGNVDPVVPEEQEIGAK